jgi:hypothetical protein
VDDLYVVTEGLRPGPDPFFLNLGTDEALTRPASDLGNAHVPIQPHSWSIILLITVCSQLTAVSMRRRPARRRKISTPRWHASWASSAHSECRRAVRSSDAWWSHTIADTSAERCGRDCVTVGI